MLKGGGMLKVVVVVYVARISLVPKVHHSMPTKLTKRKQHAGARLAWTT